MRSVATELLFIIIIIIFLFAWCNWPIWNAQLPTTDSYQRRIFFFQFRRLDHFLEA